MAKYTVTHDRPVCIGCAACEAIAPEFWTMNEDGKSDLKHAKKTMEEETVKEEILDIEETDFQSNKDAAEACPVNCIHILEDKKKII
jgi:ferredoxin